ncbi:Fc.00g107750.m01.CDS01 [Cosmosporella sp. VM-42]
MVTKLYDVLIIGGGPAGLAMATTLARQLYTALVLDSAVYRNARTKHMHNVLGFDHADPADFRAKARADLTKRYDSVEFQSVTITEVRKLESGVFEAVDEKGGVYRGRKLGLGTGVRDVMEDQPEGYDECWGRGIFHCLFCHGFEERGAESVGVLAGGFLKAPEMLTHVTPMAKRLSKSVTVYTNGNADLASAVRSNLHSSKVHFDTRKITRFALVDSGPSVKITFEDGSSKTEGFIANHPTVVQSAPFTEQLGLERLPSGDVKVEAPFNETSVKGCFAAGDAATMVKSVVMAMMMGSFAGAGMATQLQMELDKRDEL